MLDSWIASLTEANLISILLLLVVLFSVLQGWVRGFSRAAGGLFGLLGTGLLTAAALVIAVPAALYFSPAVQAWAASVVLPDSRLSGWQQLYYTAVSVLEGSTLVRFCLLLLIGYSLIRPLLGLLFLFLPFRLSGRKERPRDRKITQISRLSGAAVGFAVGLVRGLLLVFVLYLGVGLNPDSSFSRYVESSPIYSQSAAAVFEPIAGENVRSRLPVLTKAVAAEMNDILRRKYEVIDHDISPDIEEAAADIAGQASDPEEKARLLYDWIGSRIVYDYAKADHYEQNGIWHEQTPLDTFGTRLGVCIDYARLYAVMGRSQGLQVRVVTGRGYDGQGGYGAHAWNEVYIPAREAWIPLDSTWASSGDWFNTTDFGETHIKEDVL
ncbi:MULTISPECIES: transglutaminase-like domain-containing protein [unclassified Paenibacillus]|uniref:transglutaminase-like domain-containing protein n=1 Tax=unclassified Paenibacillus TaxID=185978 RepID=UPI0024049F9F|nr:MULTISPECIES: transglutaminase-like domain-containing protein [unclassified Paenibacillus]MDF9842763.1 putative membrane protein required for colicin V production [Paenibacillus sp. PastF-2]MDF9849369.1 putative membrane protein required for colicin V production [Paenibacillus sp. PastM-2]MDF9855923.1 putative membrane protein required for colicin V production [Paenibacillus sp. PastF-1]MDH6481210.1 putative membrane protein required for colicin V production [Paenibacillus sp. PastH-2]MDH65